MKINFSNKNLWRAIKLHSLISAVIMLFIALIVRNSILLLLIFILASAGLAYVAKFVSQLHKKLYIDVNMDSIKIYNTKTELVYDLNFEDMQNIVQIGLKIIIIMKDNSKIKINLKIIDYNDVKHFVKYLKYNPKIQNKNFHI